jgi:galactose-1-phosphate uridylyltransferase
MEQSGEYSSVLFFKNHGPLSGGSLPHAHMQIIGLKYIDYRSTVLPEHFRGLLISNNDNVEFNISTLPKIGFSEFNIILNDLNKLDQMANNIQLTVHYLLNHFRNCNSYNLFFYHIDERIYAKIIPRFITSPIFIGYSLPQVSDHIKDIAYQIQELYFSNNKDYR